MRDDSRDAAGFRRTPDGAIDYLHYVDKGRRLRSEAFVGNGAAALRLVHRVWRGLARGGSGLSKLGVEGGERTRRGRPARK